VTTSSNTQDMLSKIDLFAGLSSRQLKKLLGRAREVDHEAGREIAHEGLGGSAFHLLLSGEVAVSVGGRELRRLHAGEYFGEISMIDGKPRSATVTVTEDTRALAIPHLVFDELCAEEPEFTHGLLKLLCARLRQADAAAREG
jgi:CRP/FNR family transcriptional regulator, cyclic AMP receptor protein